MRTLTITPANPSVTVKLTGLANGGNVFALAYLNSFNPSALSVNYLGDGGASTPLAAVISFQVTVPAGNQLVLVVMDNISGFFGGVSYEISIPDVTPPPTGVPISPITLTAITVLLAASAAFAMRKSYC